MRNRTSFAGFAMAGVLLLGGLSAVLASCGGSENKSVDSAAVDSVVDVADSSSVSTGADAEDGAAAAAAAADGIDGIDGADGVDGTDGSSVVASGDTGAAPEVIGKPLQLTGNGVDGSKFGDKFETVMVAMTAAHGAFDDDSMWEEQQSPCEGLGTKERRVQWGSVVLVFSNGPTEFGAAGVEHLVSVYSEDAASPTPANAPDGKALLDETVGNLKTRFPGVQIYTSEIAGPSYTIKTEGDGQIGGILSGLTDKDSIVSFNAGLICID